MRVRVVMVVERQGGTSARQQRRRKMHRARRVCMAVPMLVLWMMPMLMLLRQRRWDVTRAPPRCGGAPRCPRKRALRRRTSIRCLGCREMERRKGRRERWTHHSTRQGQDRMRIGMLLRLRRSASNLHHEWRRAMQCWLRQSDGQPQGASHASLRGRGHHGGPEGRFLGALHWSSMSRRRCVCFR